MHVFLIGFMASGKSTVGPALASRLGRPFVDLDSVVEERAGMSVAEIFEREGEARFRAREREALEVVISRAAAVIATGGGTPCQGDALELMRAHGAVVALTGELGALLARAEAAGGRHARPLLAASPAELQSLHDSRMPYYRQAHVGVDTVAHGADEATLLAERRIAALEAVPREYVANSVLVATAARCYPVVVAPGALTRLGELIDARGKVAVVTDEGVAPLYLDRVRASLEAAGAEVTAIKVPPGEASKSLAKAGELAETLVDAGLDRSSSIVALGGGVVGDLAGFVAATLYRGIRVVQVPTTLLAMIDSSIGGKTGVDLPAGKNLMGAFWQPSHVIVDPELLGTLPARERRAGVGELVKYGLLDGEDLLQLTESAAPALARGEVQGAEVTRLIRRCAAYKAWVVTQDERERTGERALLNLGHTVGHAIEAEAGYGALLHGECVALGLIAACRVSAALALCEPALEQRVTELLAASGLDVELDRWLRDEVLDRMRVDKKRIGSHVRFIALEGVGRPTVRTLELTELCRLLRSQAGGLLRS